MKKLHLLMMLLFVSIAVNAQTLSPEAIAAAGNHVESSTYSVDYTTGEVTTATLIDGSATVTQGFHQPEIQFTAVENNMNTEFELYPNPTDQFVTISTDCNDPLRIYIYDAAGNTVLVTQVFTQKITLDLATLRSGSYILRIDEAAGIARNTYKIIKK